MTTSRSEREHPRRQVYATASPWGAAAEQEPESIVLKVAEPEAESLDVLDDQVGALGRGVGAPGAAPGQDRDFPAGDGAAEALVERGVCQTDDVEVIDHQAGLGRLIGVDHHVVDPSQPTGELGAEPG